MLESYTSAKNSHIADTVKIEHPIHCGPNSQIHGECTVGRYLFLNINSILYPHVKIGRYCSIARNCEVGVANHPSTFLSTHSFQYHSAQFPTDPVYRDEIKRVKWRAHPKTIIGNDVWIGAQSIIRAGVNIGDGVIIAANSVVTKDVEPYTVVGGSSAKFIKKRFTDEQIRELLALAWWDLPLKSIANLQFDNIDACIAELKIIQGKNS
ncbi:transferase hexapeptide repeat containing protein [Yersinia intermedia]|uniref:CatB-related O-acetyltransferase n=1 Tax=Yersinia intermedia TaxID=631 RepID=UPI0005E17C96|nr:CatB-related O-acetyltransferase [Yersinia intermedia]MDA5511778.1 CatB-related O-acetyltransferase [Yersinia intermedia]CNI20783.1 transferase hexapeptide repeat containing protein [Yersinia intermedia]CQD82352.1 transferase hexapeptide repeat containing protein [Yersinia intermedia]